VCVVKRFVLALLRLEMKPVEHIHAAARLAFEIDISKVEVSKGPRVFSHRLNHLYIRWKVRIIEPKDQAVSHSLLLLAPPSRSAQKSRHSPPPLPAFDRQQPPLFPSA